MRALGRSAAMEGGGDFGATSWIWDRAYAALDVLLYLQLALSGEAVASLWARRAMVRTQPGIPEARQLAAGDHPSWAAARAMSSATPTMSRRSIPTETRT